MSTKIRVHASVDGLTELPRMEIRKQGWKPLLAKNGVTPVEPCSVLLYVNSSRGRRSIQSSCW